MATLSAYQHVSAPIALLAGLAAGLVIGIINGFFVAVMRIPSFIVTLAAYIFYSGLLLHILLPNTTITLCTIPRSQASCRTMSRSHGMFWRLFQ